MRRVQRIRRLGVYHKRSFVSKNQKFNNIDRYSGKANLPNNEN